MVSILIGNICKFLRKNVIKFESFKLKFFRGNITKLPSELSLVKIYYPSEDATRYRKNALYNWYQILCK